MKKNDMKGFTLVELLAVIVILAIILVIAVPKVMTIIEDSKKATLETTAKMIASSAEKAKIQNEILGKTDKITCDDVAKMNKVDYESCEIEFDGNTAKVDIAGKGKFEGIYVCGGTKNNAVAQGEECILEVVPVSFENDDWGTIVAAVKQAKEKGTEYPYHVGEIKLIELGSFGPNIIRVAETRPCTDDLLSKTACGFVLEFLTLIEIQPMNSTATNKGGWPVSKAREYLNSTVLAEFPKELKDGIIKTKVISSHGWNDSGPLSNGNYESDDWLYLLSVEEVYGDVLEYGIDSSSGTSRQLEYYLGEGISFSNNDTLYKNTYDMDRVPNWWLRSADLGFSDSFLSISGLGDCSTTNADASYWVSPAFRLV